VQFARMTRHQDLTDVCRRRASSRRTTRRGDDRALAEPPYYAVAAVRSAADIRWSAPTRCSRVLLPSLTGIRHIWKRPHGQGRTLSTDRRKRGPAGDRPDSRGAVAPDTYASMSEQRAEVTPLIAARSWRSARPRPLSPARLMCAQNSARGWVRQARPPSRRALSLISWVLSADVDSACKESDDLGGVHARRHRP